MNFNSFQQLIARILFISLCLKSCGGATNPIIPIQEELTVSLQFHPQHNICPTNIVPLVDKQLTGQGGHVVNFYEEAGELKADVAVNTPKGFSKRHEGLNVYIEQGAELISLSRLDAKVQQRRIHFQLARGTHPAKVIIYKGSGLMGGMKRSQEDAELNNNSTSATVGIISTSRLTSSKKNRTDITDDDGEPLFQQTDETQNQALTQAPVSAISFVNLPNEIILQFFSWLSVQNIARLSQVCKFWQVLSEDPFLWKAVRLRIHGDYSVKQATKQQAIKHMLRVRVNTLSNLTTISQLVNKYNLNKKHHFIGYHNLLIQLYGSNIKLIDEYAAQGNQGASKQKIQELFYGMHFRKGPPVPAAIAFNDFLIERGDQEAIQRKIRSLIGGKGGYKRNLKAAATLNDTLVQQGNEESIKRKIEGLLYGKSGYKRNPQAIAALNESLVEQGNEGAMQRKMEGLVYGRYGYEKNHKAAIALNDALIQQGNEEAIKRKIQGLTQGDYGYKQDKKAIVAFNDSLIVQGNEEAIRRKIGGLVYGKYGYRKDTAAAVSFNDYLSEQGNQAAIERKMEGLVYGRYGYGKDLKAAVCFNEYLSEQGNQAAIERKMEGLVYGRYGYGKDLKAAVCFNEYLIQQGIQAAIARKLAGLAEGKYGYEQNLKAAVDFNEFLIGQGNEKAIQRKVSQLASGGIVYSQDIVQLRIWITSEVSKGKRWAYYLKAQGLKYGILGFKQASQIAIEYILNNNIPY
ncbi:MAG: F-box protein [Candidatus Amoebophilus sp.]